MSRSRDLASSGVTSAVLTAKAPLASPDFTGTVDLTGATVNLDNDQISGDKVSGGTIGAGTFSGTVTTSNNITANSKIISGGSSAGTITREVNTSIGNTLYEGYKFFTGGMGDLEVGDNVGLFQIVFGGVYGNAICELNTVGTVNNNTPQNPDRRIIYIENAGGTVTASHVEQIAGNRMQVSTTTTSASTNGIRIIADCQTTSGTGYFTTYIKVYGGGFNSGSFGITLTVL